MKIWAFGTSPYGLGLAASALWALSLPEYEALVDVYQEHHKREREFQQELQFASIAALRADIHNCAAGPGGKLFSRIFEPKDFMPGAKSSVEEKAREYMAMGYPPAAAVAMASSSQSRDQKLFVVKSTLEASTQRKKKSKRKQG